VNKDTSLSANNQQTEEDLITLSKLRWHCRRGVKELDVVLCNYLDNHYLDSSPEFQNAFVTLLKLEDPILMSLVMEYTHTDDEAQQQVLEKLKKPFS